MRTPHRPLMPYRTIEVLLVGSHRLPDGRTFSMDRQKIARICAQANRQRAVRIRIPFAWMHDPRAVPLELSQQESAKTEDLHPEAWLAKGFFGEAVKFAQDPTTGSLLAKVHIPRERDAEQYDLVKQVSPALWQDWIDERGVHWPELTVAHIAATPKPVQRDVRDSRAYPATLLSHPARVRAAYQLSFPATPRSSPMADEKDDDMEMDTDGGEAMDLSDVIDLLKKLDIHGMDGVSDMPTLVAALKAAVHTKLGDSGEEPDADDMGGPSDGDADNLESVAAPVLMSQPVAQRLGQLEHDDLKRQLKECLDAGKITKAIHDKEVAALTAINLSNATAQQFNPDGTRKRTDFDVRLDVYKSLPATSLTKGQKEVKLGHGLEAVPAPTPDAAGLDAELRASAKRLGIPLKQ